MSELPPLPSPYPYLRVGYVGTQPLHPEIGQHIDLAEIKDAQALADTLRKGLDYALFENQGAERLSDHQLRMLTAMEAEGIPTVMHAYTAANLDTELAAVVSHVVAESALSQEARKQVGPERSFDLQQTLDPRQVLLGAPEQSASTDPGFLSAEKVAERRRLISAFSPRAQTDRLVSFLGLLPEPVPLVTVVIVSRRAENLDYALQSLKLQDYPRLDPLLVIDPLYESVARQGTECWSIPVRVEVAQPRSTLGDRLNLGVLHAFGDAVTIFEESAFYGPQHITDLLQALEYSGAHMVGKASWLELTSEANQPTVKAPGLQYVFDKIPATGTLTMHRSTARALGFPRRARGVNWAVSQRVLDGGGTIFSTHAHDTVMLRKGQTMADLDHQIRQTEAFIHRACNDPAEKNI